MGGEKGVGVENCAGPCDLRAIRGHFANHGSPDNPAAVYKRGQKVAIKYQRNNHGPGGFNRFTLVPPGKMMDKATHTRNAFHYSCWGANPVQASGAELGKDKYGYSTVGNDGEEHNYPKGYYKTIITIPSVIPDGKYVLGWVWHGGVGGGVKGNSPQEPSPYGYFADYWSCSYVEIRGGAPLQREYTPKFDNDMKQYSNEGCMSANDAPGVCSWEPCEVRGKYQKPRPFKNGSPKPIKPEMFGGKSPSGNGSGGNRPQPPKKPNRKPSGSSGKSIALKKRACGCLAAGNRCRRGLAKKTRGYCRKNTSMWAQSHICKDSCCKLCKLRLRKTRYLCEKPDIKSLCGLW